MLCYEMFLYILYVGCSVSSTITFVSHSAEQFGMLNYMHECICILSFTVMYLRFQAIRGSLCAIKSD